MWTVNADELSTPEKNPKRQIVGRQIPKIDQNSIRKCLTETRTVRVKLELN